MRRSALLGLVLSTGLLLLASGPARAAEVGDVAPDFEGRDYFNTEPITLKELRGHVVLLELFSVT